MMQRVVGIPGQPHKWVDAICAWACGDLVQWRYCFAVVPPGLAPIADNPWRDCDYPNAGMPNWENPTMEFRVHDALVFGPDPVLKYEPPEPLQWDEPSSHWIKGGAA